MFQVLTGVQRSLNLEKVDIAQAYFLTYLALAWNFRIVIKVTNITMPSVLTYKSEPLAPLYVVAIYQLASAKNISTRSPGSEFILVLAFQTGFSGTFETS